MKLFYLFFFVLIAINTQAQSNELIQWTTTFKDLGDYKLEITFDASIKEDWYVYSQLLESEDGPIPISINFEVPGVTILSNKETTSSPDNRIDGLDPLFEMNLTKFKKDLKITLEISYTKLPIKGYLEYMTGDPTRLFPPYDIDFAYYKDGKQTSTLNQFNFKRQNIIESLAKSSKTTPNLDPNNPLYQYLNALEKAKKENKPLLVVFTGYGATGEREMQENIYTQESIHNILNKVYTVVYLYVDSRKSLEFPILNQDGLTIKTEGQCWAEFQKTNFQVQSQPYFVILNSKEEVLTTPIGYTRSVDDFENFLRSGIKAYNKNH
jgi:thioredoxin-related protein